MPAEVSIVLDLMLDVSEEELCGLQCIRERDQEALMQDTSFPWSFVMVCF